MLNIERATNVLCKAYIVYRSTYRRLKLDEETFQVGSPNTLNYAGITVPWIAFRLFTLRLSDSKEISFSMLIKYTES